MTHSGELESSYHQLMTLSRKAGTGWHMHEQKQHDAITKPTCQDPCEVNGHQLDAAGRLGFQRLSLFLDDAKTARSLVPKAPKKKAKKDSDYMTMHVAIVEASLRHDPAGCRGG